MYLGLDLGTTNVKAIVADADGRVVSAGAAPVQRYHTPDGGVEQDIDEIWRAVETAIRSAVGRVHAAAIQAVGVSSQGGALQVLDADDQPRGRVISWLDSRGASYDAALTAELGGDFFARRVGHGASYVAIGQLLRLKSESPELLERPNRIGFVGDLIVGRLCERRAHDATSLGIAMLNNPWLKRPDPDVLQRLGLDEGQLPSLLPATTPAGALGETAAAATGLPAGIPVSPAVHDQYTVSLGAAAVAEGDVSLGTGTAWVLLANTATLAPPATPDAFVCSHPIEGLYGQLLSMVNGGSAIHWAMNLLGHQHVDGQEVDRLLDAAPPGAEGLRFWPFLSSWPIDKGGIGLKGRLSGITLAHEPAHLVRAVVEGLACELLRHVRQLVAAGIRVDRLIVCGSAAASRHTPQIIADVSRLPVCCVAAADISALGAVMLARALVEPDVKLDDISRQWAPPRRTVTPSENAAMYEGLYEEYLSVLDGQLQ
jgi:sugar (pentulose or hexulose) kinase